MKIGVLCPSDIAYRRFMPALQQMGSFEFVGVGVHSLEERFGPEKPETEITRRIMKGEHEKAQRFVDQYSGEIFESYESMVSSDQIDAVYIPLPPALHEQWARRAIEYHKHVLVEKPATVSGNATKVLVAEAKKNNVAFHENYMFIFHEQIAYIDQLIEDGEIGDVRLYRVTFGFPRRANDDFRYDKSLGGGALLDTGGYTLKYANHLLGDTAKLLYAKINHIRDFEVDIGGSAALVNDQGVIAQIAFGMDNSYQCKLEVWGSNGHLSTNRILTAPAGFVPEVIIEKGNELYAKSLPADDTFQKSLQHFLGCILDSQKRIAGYESMIHQAELMAAFERLAQQDS